MQRNEDPRQPHSEPNTLWGTKCTPSSIECTLPIFCAQTIEMAYGHISFEASYQFAARSRTISLIKTLEVKLYPSRLHEYI